MRIKMTIEELYNGIKDYFDLNDTENILENKKYMKQEINNIIGNEVVACNKEYSVIFDTESLYVEFFDDLIKISFLNGEYILNCLKEAHIEYVPVDLELPIIKDIFGYKLEKRRVRNKIKSR